jgi:nucleoside-diphosphate-sugar epimerase
MAKSIKGKVTVLGINGHVGQYVARAFAEAGWDVSGMGRSNKHPMSGVTFVKGDADNVADMRAAIGDAEVVVNALNLPYDKWFNGAMETQTSKVIEAVGKTGKTLLYPGNIYNYAAALRQVTPDSPQHPERPRGEIRVRCETMLRQAAERGDLQAIILRAGDFFGPDVHMDWFDQAILAQKGKVAAPGAPGIGHSWAYLPDLARAFEKLAWHRHEFGAFENFHFAGHFVTSERLVAAIQKAAPAPLKVVSFPWAMLPVVGLFNPIMREISKMHYLWQNPMLLMDARLDAILGADFGTPYDEAIAETVAPFFVAAQRPPDPAAA